MLQTAYTSRTRRKCVKIRILGDDKLENSVVGVNCVQSTCFTELSNGHARIWFFFPDRNSTLWEIVFPWWWKRGLRWLLFSGSFLQVMFTLLFCLIPKEIRTTCLVDNLQLFFLHFYFKRPLIDDRFCCSAISFNNYLSSLSVYIWVYIKHSLILHTSQYFWLAAFRNQRNKPINCLKRRQTFFFFCKFWKLGRTSYKKMNKHKQVIFNNIQKYHIYFTNILVHEFQHRYVKSK